MRALLGLSLLLGFVAVGLEPVHGSQQWTNREGKTITASFVRLSPNGNSVMLQQGEARYEVELSRLNDDSRRQALNLQEKKSDWASQEALKPLLTEEILVDLLRFDQTALIGRHYLVDGRIGRILQPAFASSTQPRLVLELGTVTPVDFSGYSASGVPKLRITSENVVLLTPIRRSGLRSYSEAELVRLGQAVVIQVRVDRNEVVGLGFADPIEARDARQSSAPLPFARYLNGWGVALAPNVFSSSQAQQPDAVGSKTSNPEPGAPSSSPAPTSPAQSWQNSLLQWALSLMGQGGQKPSESP